MISITNFPISIPEYCCSYNGKLHRHGFYQRNVINGNATYTIYIARKICPICRQTYSQIPNILIPHFQYSYQVIFTILTYMSLKELSYQLILKTLEQQNTISISNQHLSFYRQYFIHSRSLIKLFLTAHPQFYYDIDFTH